MAKLSDTGSRPLDRTPAYRAPRAAPTQPDPVIVDPQESLHGMADRMHPVKSR